MRIITSSYKQMLEDRLINAFYTYICLTTSIRDPHPLMILPDKRQTPRNHEPKLKEGGITKWQDTHQTP